MRSPLPLAPSLVVHNRLLSAVAVGLPCPERADLDTQTVTILPGQNTLVKLPLHVVKKRRLTISFCPASTSSSQASNPEDDQQTLHGGSTQTDANVASSVASLRVLLNARERRHGGPSNSTSWDPIKLTTEDGSKLGYWALQGTPRICDDDDTIPSLQVLLLPVRASKSFMSLLPDSVPISALSVPGTHETFARYGWPISQCQEVSSTIRTQLNDGIRFMDLRVAPKGSPGQERLLAYHGATAERIELGDALQQVYEFLATEREETVIVSIKQEYGDRQLMKRLLFDLYVRPNQQKWFLEPRVPSLGEARGKIIMFSRFGAAGEDRVGGIHPPMWPNNKKGIWGYTLPLSGQKVLTQDYYNIGSASEIVTKFSLASQLLDEAGACPDVFALNFISAATFPRATPPVVAKGWWEKGPKCIAIEGMNRRMVDLIADKVISQLAANEATTILKGEADDSLATLADGPAAATPGLQACYAIDFYDYENASSLIPLLIEANFTEAMIEARRTEDKSKA